MSEQVAVELVKLMPTVLQLGFIAALIAVFHGEIKRQLFSRMSEFKAFGLELTFVREELDKAVVKQATIVSEGDRSRVLRRATRVAPVLQGSRILWVDDNPENNISERRILLSFGISVDLARSTQEALSMLRQHQYDAVISDMKRDGVLTEGLNLLKEMEKDPRIMCWTVLYSRGYDPSKGLPPPAFGGTNRPHQLLHYVMDILERERS